jgi:hypothetical protein
MTAETVLRVIDTETCDLQAGSSRLRPWMW